MSLQPRIADAFVYAFPAYEIARTRWASVASPANPSRRPAGTLVHRRTLADHRARTVTTPNHDTLYSTAWLDLARGPVRLSVPAIRERYWSVALLDVVGNNFAMLGSRLDGERAVDVTIVGPADTTRHAGRVVRAPANDVWLLGRWLVTGDDDAPAVHAIQDAVRLEAPPGDGTPQAVAPTSSTDPANFLDVVNEMLGRNPVPGDERALVAGWHDLGVRPGERGAYARLDPGTAAAWRAALGPAHERLRDGLARGGRRVHGWSVPAPQVGNFGRDYGLRAAVALGGLAALEPCEAMYLSRDASDDGTPLTGERRYALRLPPAGIDAKAFWSLSMYERMPDGRLFFVDNPVGRYAIGDRTPELARGAGRAPEVAIQQAPSADGTLWLPAPPGPFTLVLRAYEPGEALLAGRAPLPTIEPR